MSGPHTGVSAATNASAIEPALRSSHDLLDLLARLQGQFIATTDWRKVFDDMLSEVLNLTESEYGFIGEVLFKDDGAPYLKTYALTNIAWDAETRKFYEDNAPEGLEFTNLDTLFGRVMATGEMVIANDPMRDPRGGGLPPGHPSLDAFLGLPFHSGSELVGMLGIANRSGGYDRDFAEWLEPLSRTCGNLVQALRLERRRKLTEEALRYSEARTSAIVDTVLEGIISIDERGIIEAFNPAASGIFGYAPSEVIGRNIKLLMPPPDHDRHDDYLHNYLATHEAKVIGVGREVVGLRKDGTTFPMELAVAPMRVDDRVMFTGVVRDITERKRFEQRLKKSKEQADKANRAKSEFLSSMSHELRTPLNSILGFAQLMRDDPRESPSQTHKEYLEYVLKGGEHLLDLINQVLELAKIEAGKCILAMECIQPREVIEECLALTQQLADKRGIQIVDRTSRTELPAIEADAMRFKQVLLNLLSNGVKYNKEGGLLTIACELAPESRLRFSVTDTGLGIPSERRHELFQPFNRLGAENSDIEGTGIGLAITKQLAELMGGGIGFESELGQGSTFWVEFELTTSETSSLPAERSGEARTSLAVRSESDEMHTLLYVEDNPSNLRLMEEIINRIANVTMLSAHTAELGLEIAAVCKPQVIIMDINLPGMSGLDALERLRRTSKTSDIPVIALSANAMPSDIELGLEAGFFRYLTKPIQIGEVLSGIEEALEAA